MLVDVVVDTNVLMHADNPGSGMQAFSLKFLNLLLSKETKVVVDEGFDLISEKNRSLIGSEYLKNLNHGGFGYAVISILAQTARIKVIKKSVPPNIHRFITSNIGNTRDRTFVKITYNSEEKTLASHDFEDFDEEFRSLIKRKYTIFIVTSDNCRAKL